ncbi:hypothetical protein CYY_009890 [Polysphondylium violaceum]|uniref:WD40 repeat-containing protein n=1 Tax=Polysphondylium violaceum TaxID=133409 RepID=A0A8J4UV26_9MYCE|nr:hypothetical protein CYY_009890 [Polysphondylium violaceum]
METNNSNNASSYIIFKSKNHLNTSYSPIDIHPIHPWILYSDSDNNVIIQNYVNNEKILNFSISQHDEEKREQLLLQRKVPTLSSLNNVNLANSNSPSNSNSNTGINNNSPSNTGLLGNSPNTPSITYIGAGSGAPSLSSSGGGLTNSSPLVPSFHSSAAAQTLAHRSPNNTISLKSSLNNNIENQNTNTNPNNNLNNNNDFAAFEKIEKLGQIKFLYFFDRHTKACKDRKPKISQNKLNLNSYKPNSTIGTDDYIVVVAENRIVFINYHSQRLREIKIPIFETKPPSAVEFFSNSPLIAFGGPDSIIRLWNTDKWELEKQLSGGHPKGSVIKLKSIEMEGDFLVSAGTDGFICVWNVKTGTLATQFTKVHEILDITYDHVTGQILALTSDRTIIIYDINNLKEVAKISSGKKEFFSIESFYHPRFSQDLLLSMKNPAQVTFFSRLPNTAVGNSNNREFTIDFDTLLGAGKKEKSKLYKVIQHPLNPHLLLCWVNKTIYIISTLATSVPIFATSFNATTNDHTVYYPHQGYLYASSLTNILVCEKNKTPIQVPPNEYYKLDISPSGKYLSILGVASSTYQIIETGTWKVIEKGSALDIAWSGRGKDSEKVGLLEKVFESVDTVKKKKTLGSILPGVGGKTKKEEQVLSKILLKTKEFNNNVTQELLLHANEDRISGGLLLGVYHRDKEGSVLNLLLNQSGMTGSGGAAANSNSNNSNNAQVIETPIITTGEETESKSFQLLDWWTLQPVGEHLPPPLKIYWDSNQTHCAIAYTHYFCIFKLRPSFHMLCRWPFSLTSAVWHNNTLFFSTPTDIQCLFPHKHESAPIILASASGNIFPEDLYDASVGSLSSSKPNQSFSLLPNIRPPGAISLVEVNNEGLVLIDTNYKFYCIPLTHYLLKFFILAQMEAFDLAMKCATMVDPKYHYLMSKFLTVRGHPKECLQLSGISNFLKFLICINNESYDASLDIIPLLSDAIRSSHSGSIVNELSGEDITLSGLGKMCIDIGQKSQNKGDFNVAERAFKLATSLEPHCAFQQLSLHYVFLKKTSELKDLQQQIQQSFPLESNLISLFLD